MNRALTCGIVILSAAKNLLWAKTIAKADSSSLCRSG